MQVARANKQSEVLVPLGYPRSLSQLYRSIAFLFGYSERLQLDPDDL